MNVDILGGDNFATSQAVQLGSWFSREAGRFGKFVKKNAGKVGKLALEANPLYEVGRLDVALAKKGYRTAKHFLGDDSVGMGFDLSSIFHAADNIIDTTNRITDPGRPGAPMPVMKKKGISPVLIGGIAVVAILALVMSKKKTAIVAVPPSVV
jgi:hypothetical protein